MKKVLYILTGENEIKKVPNKKDICFSLCPMLEKHNQYQIFYPDPIKTSKLSSNQLLEGKKMSNIILNLIKKTIHIKERDLIEEILIPYLETKISIYLYLKNVFPSLYIYKIFIKGKWQSFHNLDSLIIAIEDKYSNEEGNIYEHISKYTKYKITPIKKLLSNFQVYLINRIINKKSIYLLSNNKSYFMPNIFYELKKRGKNIITYKVSHKLADIFCILIKQSLSIIFNKKNSINEFFLIPTLHKYKIYFNNNIHKIEHPDKNYIKFLLKDVEKYLNVNNGYQIYTYRLFKNLKINQIKGVFHSNRFPDLNSLSFILSYLNQQQHLISHGTHTLQKSDKSGIWSSENQAIGMIKTKIPQVNIYSQSQFSDEYLLSQNLKFKKINPLNVQKIDDLKDNSKFNILCAGTVKQLGARRYYFESCFEYIHSITELANKFKELDFDIKITLRIRDVNHEINPRIKILLAEQFKDLIEISKTKNISDDICKSNCLIALSSTTLEDAINHGVPSMSYGLSEYDHFSHYKDSKFKISKRTENYNKLRKIEILLNKNFIYLRKGLLKRKKDIYDFIL